MQTSLSHSYVACAVLTATALAFSLPANAQQEPARDQGWYLGLGLGAGKYSFNSADFRTNEIGRSLGVTSGSPSGADGNSLALKVFVGYNINKNLGLELTSASLDEVKIEYANAVGGAKLATGKYTGDAVALAAVGRYEFDGGFLLQGKAGVAFTSAKLDYAIARPNGTLVTDDPSVNRTNFYWSAGVGYKFNPRWVATLDYDDFGKLGNANTTGRATMRTVMASAQYRF